MAFGTFSLTGHFDAYGGSPASGAVRIDGNPQVIVDTAGNKIKVGPRAVVLDTSGNFQIDLPSNSTSGNSTTIAFTVTPLLKGLAGMAPVSFYARPISSTVDLSAITTTTIVPLTPGAVSTTDFAAYQTAVAAAYVPKPAAGTTAGYAPVVQADGSIAYAAVSGGGGAALKTVGAVVTS